MIILFKIGRYTLSVPDDADVQAISEEFLEQIQGVAKPTLIEIAPIAANLGIKVSLWSTE